MVLEGVALLGCGCGLHSRAYALLSPSIWEEPLPYVVIKSMLMGTIPIAARTGGVPEVVVR